MAITATKIDLIGNLSVTAGRYWQKIPYIAFRNLPIDSIVNIEAEIRNDFRHRQPNIDPLGHLLFHPPTPGIGDLDGYTLLHPYISEAIAINLPPTKYQSRKSPAMIPKVGTPEQGGNIYVWDLKITLLGGVQRGLDWGYLEVTPRVS